MIVTKKIKIYENIFHYFILLRHKVLLPNFFPFAEKIPGGLTIVSVTLNLCFKIPLTSSQ